MKIHRLIPIIVMALFVFAGCDNPSGGCIEDKYDVCPDGTQYLSAECVNGVLGQIDWHDDPCGDKDITTLFVNSTLANCVDLPGSTFTNCLQVKEDQNDDWELFTGRIIDFSWDRGYFYELQVVVIPVNPPVNGSSIDYKLVKIVSKVADPSIIVCTEADNTYYVCDDGTQYPKTICENGTLASADYVTDPCRGCTDDKYEVCPDGTQYKAATCHNGELFTINYFADPCGNNY